MNKVYYLLIPLLCVLCSATMGASSPNIIILYADDMGFGDLGVNNPESKIPTPHLDTLAEEGMRFTDGHSSSGICTPSRFALLTGQYHWRRFHDIVHSFGPSVFRPDDFTLPKMMKSKGYKTACIGKWHLGWDWEAVTTNANAFTTIVRWNGERKVYLPNAFDWSAPVSGGPLSQGFDYYFGDGTINFPPYCWVENDRILEAPTEMVDTELFKKIPEGSWEFREGPMVKGWDPYQVLPTLTDKAVNWIKQQKADEQFFLYFAFTSPHAPIIPNEAYRGRSEAGPYGDFVVETDAMAGRLLQALEEAGLAENTVVVFTADNGPEKYAYDRLKNYDHWSSAPLRGLKRDVWEGGHRVPFIVKWPGKTVPGSVSDENISQVDLAATFASMIDYPLSPEDAIDSYNLVPLLRGKKYAEPLRKASIQNTFEEVFALRQGDWIYIDAPSGERSKCPPWFNEMMGYTTNETPTLLYHLKNDPGQRNNLSQEQSEKAAHMKALLELYKAGQGCAPHAEQLPAE